MWRYAATLLCLCALASLASCRAQSVADTMTAQPCAIWCAGPILAQVQAANLSADSKTFVDQPLVNTTVAEAQARFAALPTYANNGSVQYAPLVAYVNATFGQAGSDLEPYVAPDFRQQPANFVPLVQQPAIRQWALAINSLWKLLSREVSPSVEQDPEAHTLLPLPNPMVIAGSRFREVYYWDSFWIVKGLLVSGMNDTAKSVVGNLLYMLDQYGFVPNGARKYYLNRSQPPLLSNMVAAVYQATADRAFLQNAYAGLVEEHRYWTSSPKQVTVDGRQLSRYYAAWDMPRPESYREDSALVQGLPADEAAQLLRNIASAAESGWDFSSRWFADGQNLSTIRTTDIIPADLNAYLYQMENNLALFATVLGNSSEADMFSRAADARRAAIQDLMWDPIAGHWTDLVILDIDNNDTVGEYEQATGMYVSNYIPLWVGIAEANSTQAANATASFINSGLIQAAGVATSLYPTGQQWDFPNAWPPLVDIMIEAMDTYGGARGAAMAQQLAQTWLNTNYVGYQQIHKMVEKFDARHPGTAGGGGEYNVQDGFGWTNGVVLSLLQRYGWQGSVPAPAQAPASRTPDVASASTSG